MLNTVLRPAYIYEGKGNVMQGKNRKSPIPDEPERDFLQNILKENYFFLPSAASS